MVGDILKEVKPMSSFSLLSATIPSPAQRPQASSCLQRPFPGICDRFYYLLIGQVSLKPRSYTWEGCMKHRSNRILIWSTPLVLRRLSAWSGRPSALTLTRYTRQHLGPLHRITSHDCSAKGGSCCTTMPKRQLKRMQSGRKAKRL